MKREHKKAKEDLLKAQWELEHNTDLITNAHQIVKQRCAKLRELRRMLKAAQSKLTKPLENYTGRYDWHTGRTEYQHKGAQQVARLQNSIELDRDYLRQVLQDIASAPQKQIELQATVDKLMSEVELWEGLQVRIDAKTKAKAKAKAKAATKAKPISNIDTIKTLPDNTTGKALAATLTQWETSKYVTVTQDEQSVIVKVGLLKKFTQFAQLNLQVSPCTPIKFGRCGSTLDSVKALWIAYDDWGQARLFDAPKVASYQLGLVS